MWPSKPMASDLDNCKEIGQSPMTDCIGDQDDDNEVRESASVAHSGDEIVELRVGMAVANQTEAYDLYNRYALNQGFSIRKRKPLYKSRSDELRGYIFVCSKEGKSEEKCPFDERKTRRLDTRTECMASVKFEVIKGDAWMISKFISNHNHDLVPPEHRRFLQSGRKMLDTSKGVINSMIDVGIRPTKAYAYLAKEVGGVQNMEFTERDCHNFLQAQKENMIGPGDAQSLINYFKTKLVDNAFFFHHEQFDDQGRLTNLFWTDAASRVDYDCFGDVVIFDTTYRTNKYNLICAPFVGVNHHWKNVYFGCAFLQDETTKSFEWVFETFLEAMGDKAPQTIFTDQDQAMANAIKKVFPRSCHRLCTWHISKNATQHISHLYAKPGFKDQFTYLLKSCKLEMEFESKWQEMVDQWGVSGNKWLSKLYELRVKWSPAFNRDTFSADIRSTQRSESTNNVFHMISRQTMTLTQFVHHYEDSVSRMREIEKEDDYNCSRGTAKLQVRGNSLFKHAANVYTSRIFRMFEDEFLQCVSCKFVDTCTIGNVKVFMVKGRESSREYVVHFDSSSLTVACSCKKFESMGLLCHHALSILNTVADTNKIPDQYILKRWTKGAKKRVSSEIQAPQFQNSKKSSRIVRLNNLMRRAYSVMSLCADSDDKAEIAFKNLDRTLYEMERKDLAANIEVNVTGQQTIEEVDDVSCSVQEKPVLDPPRRWPKGVSYGRQKGCLEKRQRKSLKEIKGCQIPYPKGPNMLGKGTSVVNIRPEQMLSSSTSILSFGAPTSTNLNNQFVPFWGIQPNSLITNVALPSQLQLSGHPN